MPLPSQKTIFSGIQPSGILHLGNYLGALKQWVALQADNTCYYCIVDEHAITAPYEPDELQERITTTFALYLAAGLDPDKSIIFVQSHVPAHTELGWLLATQTPYGELTRMTQFKDKARKISGGRLENLIPTNGDDAAASVTVGLFAYPILQAADILLYEANTVPVGEDQIQHIELARDIAKRFNNKFGEVFTLPESFVISGAARIMSLTDPTKKMSKSDNAKSYIALTDAPDTIRKKVMGAVTETEFNLRADTPSIRNLLTIFQALSNESLPNIEARFLNQGYKEFKSALADLVIETIAPIQARYQELRQNDDELRILLSRGRDQAKPVAEHLLFNVKKKLGLV